MFILIVLCTLLSAAISTQAADQTATLANDSGDLIGGDKYEADGKNDQSFQSECFGCKGDDEYGADAESVEFGAENDYGADAENVEYGGDAESDEFGAENDYGADAENDEYGAESVEDAGQTATLAKDSGDLIGDDKYEADGKNEDFYQSSICYGCR